MTVLKDLKTIFHMIQSKSGKSQTERLENFYRNQADHYDEFRKKLLPSRKMLMNQFTDIDDKIWVDVGAGTGHNLDILGSDKAKRFKKIYLVDLSQALLNKAQQKVKNYGLKNVELIHQDISEVNFGKELDLVTFSYSLTMIPNWYVVVDKMINSLKSGGRLGTVDFYVSKKYAHSEMMQHSVWTRHFWPLWFSWDNVFLNSDHLPYLINSLGIDYLYEGKSWIPYAPFGTVPHYVFIGVKQD